MPTTTARFGFPFILAVKGPDGNGLTRQRHHRHLHAAPEKPASPTRWPNALRQIHRIAELRINDLLKRDTHGLRPAP